MIGAEVLMNLSQQRRKIMLKYLDDLTSDTELTTEKITKINELKRFIEEKKYGLVWEEHDEDVDLKMRDSVLVFLNDEERSIRGKEGLTNFIIEGDNLHSLHLLQKTHNENIDIIYIDPPYNTNNSLTYNDSRVSQDDDFRHSLWLSFMSRRLKIAHKLLNDKGLMFLSIDDNEGYNLKVLCDEIFGEENFMGSFSVTKAEGGGQAKYIVKGHDFLLVYAKDLANTYPMGRPKDIRGKIFEKDGEQYWIQEDAYRKVFGQYGNLHYEEILEYRDQAFKDDIDNKIKSGEVILLDKGPEGMHIIGKVRKVSEDYSKYHSVIKHLNADGKNDLASMGLEDLFDYPKPVSLIKEIISGAAFLRPGDLTVLDFFAGSGTTGQAVLELVKELDLQRNISFILCTNNEVSSKQKLKFVQSKGYLVDYKPTKQTTDGAIENRINKELEAKGLTLENLIEQNPEEYEKYGICQSVTYPRIKNVITGYKYQNKGSKELLKKKITPKNFDNLSDIKTKIEKIIEKGEYSSYKTKIDEKNNLILEGYFSQGEEYLPIESNLIYLKTGFVSKFEESELTLKDKLVSYISPLIEIQNLSDLSRGDIAIVLDENELDMIIDNEHIKKVYLASDIFLLPKHKNYMNSNNIKYEYVPDYFFKNELLEAGEL